MLPRNIFKNIYDEVTEDIFAMNNVRIFNKEIEKKKMGGGMFMLCYVFSQPSSVKRLA